MTREEAINEIKSWAIPSEKGREVLETLIPELRESEDERIIKTLQEYVKNRNWALNGPTQDEVLAWLERQKDASKAIEAVDRIDKYIDEHLANAHDMKDSNPDKKYYRGWDDALGEMSGILQDVYSNEKRKEDKPSIFPPGLGYVRWNPISSAEWSYPYGRNETADRLVSLAECLEMDGDCLFNGYSGTECGKFLRELARKQVECKLEEWNEEDERNLQKCIKIVERWEEDYDIAYAPYSNMLKSLKPSWRPSEEQMEALRECGECKRCIKKL